MHGLLHRPTIPSTLPLPLLPFSFLLAKPHRSQKFVQLGCPNCDGFLEMAGHPDTIADCTSQVFEGLITLSDPKGSWVAKWQRLEGYQEGVYATKVVGAVSENFFAGGLGVGWEGLGVRKGALGEWEGGRRKKRG